MRLSLACLLSRARLPTIAGCIALGFVWALVLPGCGTNPINPEGCRKIEKARCAAAPLCEHFGPNFNVDQCTRFYHDQCMRGLSATSDPGEPQINACTSAINEAANCLRNNTQPCVIAELTITDPCAIIVTPERFPSCNFLDPEITADSAPPREPVVEDAAAEQPPDAQDDDADDNADESPESLWPP